MAQFRAPVLLHLLVLLHRDSHAVKNATAECAASIHIRFWVMEVIMDVGFLCC